MTKKELRSAALFDLASTENAMYIVSQQLLIVLGLWLAFGG